MSNLVPDATRNCGDDQQMKKMLGKKTKVHDQQNPGGTQRSNVEMNSVEDVKRNGDETDKDVSHPNE